MTVAVAAALFPPAELNCQQAAQMHLRNQETCVRVTHSNLHAWITAPWHLQQLQPTCNTGVSLQHVL
jgi:hypothetical protein